jgi:hypothetical protein
MRDAAPQVARSVAGVSATGHRPTTNDVPIVSSRKALKHSPYDKSQTRICLRNFSLCHRSDRKRDTRAPERRPDDDQVSRRFHLGRSFAYRCHLSDDNHLCRVDLLLESAYSST